MSEEPNYKMMEVLTENEHIKDKLITALENEIQRLKDKVIYLESLLQPNPIEADQGSNMVAPIGSKSLRLIRTVSEVSATLEKRSLERSKFPKSAEEISDEI